MPSDRANLPPFNVVAIYEDLDRGREAIGALELAGVEGGDISLLAPGSSVGDDTSSTDARALGEVGKRTGAGAAAGSLLGGAAGFLIGLAAFSIPGVGPVVGAGVWAASAGGAAAGGTVGGILGAESALRNSPAWERTFTPVERGAVAVGVHTEDQERMEHAVEALRKTEPSDVHSFDASGEPLEIGER